MNICGQLFVNEDGDLATCVLLEHDDPQHCDGQDRILDIRDLDVELDLLEAA